MQQNNNYEPKKHTIVTKELLLTSANEQQSPKRRRRVITDLADVHEIRLEYLNILQITCLWPLSNLVKLKLNNNAIEKIENLDSLVHLCELDLSFNRIRVIENLEALANIRVLSFYDNEIEVVQGIEHMQNLAILSLGKNNVSDTETHVLYLRKLKGLRSLQMLGNPCAKKNGYASYLMAFVPQLVYYGYKMISDQERAEAAEEHCRALSELQEAESKKRKEVDAARLEEEKIAQQALSYVEYLDEDSLFRMMFSQDEDGKKLVRLNQGTEAAYEQYRQRFAAVSHALYELGLKEEKLRREEIEALDGVFDDVLTTTTNKARAVLNSVQGKRTEITVRVTQMLREAALVADDADIDDDAIDEIDKLARHLAWEFGEYVHGVWSKLLHEETVVHEQIEEMSRIFEANLNDMVSAFLEVAQDHFAQLRSFETEYSDNLMPMVVVYLNGLEDHKKSPFELEISEDKEALNNCLQGSHFMHLQIIDDRQDRMVTRLKEWKTRFLNNLVEDETSRNRNRILEITHFLNYHKENATVAKLLGQQEEIGEKESEFTVTSSEAEKYDLHSDEEDY
ncbi:dynein regulatory complex subunit 3-like [Copidosoma floridanum]|uniref:dynein regulatory complex subunit 3-like n=1 Tax=Copidosoma floridanum TaxID=29053 RepID=UPI0006C940CC|nr:dynein regulatory complex subunit 3-like [Copidosoma floridanum]